MDKFCGNCGNKLAAEETFCGQCGAKVEDAPVAAVAAEKKSFDIKAENELQMLLVKTEQLGSKLVAIIKEINDEESFAKAETNKEIESLINLSDIKSNISSLATEKNVITEKQKETLDKVELLKNKLQSLYNEKTVLNESISAVNRDISSLNDEIEASENGVKVTNDKVNEITNKIFKLNNSITTLDANEKFYRGLKDSFEGFQDAVRRLMTASKDEPELAKRIKGVVASVIHTDKNYETAIEIAMGNATDGLKQIADFVTDSVDNDGVVKAVQKFVGENYGI